MPSSLACSSRSPAPAAPVAWQARRDRARAFGYPGRHGLERLERRATCRAGAGAGEPSTAYFDRADSSASSASAARDLLRVVERGDPGRKRPKRHLSHFEAFSMPATGAWRAEEFRDLPPCASSRRDLELWLGNKPCGSGAPFESPSSAHDRRNPLCSPSWSACSRYRPPVHSKSIAGASAEVSGCPKHLLHLAPRTRPAGWTNTCSASWTSWNSTSPRTSRATSSGPSRHGRNSFWGHYREATIAYRLGDYAVAVDHLNRCIEQRPGSPALRVQIAGCLYELDRFVEALEACDKALAADPDQPEPYLSRSFVRKRMGQEEGSAEDIRKFETLARKQGRSNLGESRLISVLPHHRDSGKDQDLWDNDLPRRILAVDPDDLDARMVLASQLMHKGDMKGALEQTEEILRLNPGHLWALYSRAYACLVLSRGKLHSDLRAQADRDFAVFLSHPRLEEFLRENTHALRAYQLSAWSCLERKDFKQAELVALAGVDHAERFGELRGDLHFTLARVYAAEAGNDPVLLAKTFEQLAVALAIPCHVPTCLLDYFESDPAFDHCRAVIRPLLEEAFPLNPPANMIGF